MMFEEAWLSYHTVNNSSYRPYLTRITYNIEDDIIRNAIEEATIAIKKMYGICLQSECCAMEAVSEGIVLFLNKEGCEQLGSYDISMAEKVIRIEASSSVGILYGVFHLLRSMSMEEDPCEHVACSPSNAYRMLNHWDNLDGSIERGYAGNSFFFCENKVLITERTKTYARLLASVGINGVVINNVNVTKDAALLITSKYRNSLIHLAGLLNSYGIQLFLSIQYSAPMSIGQLETADPCDERVIHWWEGVCRELFLTIPNFGGFLVKADSEGNVGPATYGRTQAQGANMLAEIIKPYGGIVIWRCFVYNCQQDWRDRKTDRAKSSFEEFAPLDGEFHDNVMLQIKNGPMDFQVREPVHPLFGELDHTNTMLEVQLAQEYTGQQIHVCYLIPMIKDILEFQTYGNSNKDCVKDRIRGIAAVANTGDDPNWTGHDLAAANLYGYGRLTFQLELDARQIAEEWCRMTFGVDASLCSSISTMLMNSRETYEHYTAPLGIGWMVNPSNHYGPNVDGYEYDRWGTYHRADCHGIGVDRTSEGTNFTSQYKEPLASLYDDIATCPEELLLFFHRLQYSYQLRSGKTIIQHIYDSHFDGVDEVQEMISSWMALEGGMDAIVYNRVLKRLYMQLESAREWRDVINTYFYRKSGIDDSRGRIIY